MKGEGGWLWGRLTVEEDGHRGVTINMGILLTLYIYQGLGVRHTHRKYMTC